MFPWCRLPGKNVQAAAGHGTVAKEGNSMLQKGRNMLLPLLIPALCLAVWYLVSEAGIVAEYLMPHPKTIFRAAISYIFGSPGNGAYAGRFLSDFTASLTRVSLGFALASTLAVPLGLLSGRVVAVNRLVSSTINGLRAVPGICWLPPAMIWFGIGLKTTIFLVAMAAFFPIYINTLTGARLAPRIYLQAGAMLGVTRLRGVFAILIPLAMPNIIAGLRLGLGISWAYLVLGELTGVPDGLGAVIMDARMLGQVDIIIVGILLIALIGRMCDRLLLLVMCLCFKSAARQPQ
jgi:sulfonate transport system permease protein